MAKTKSSKDETAEEVVSGSLTQEELSAYQQDLATHTGIDIHYGNDPEWVIEHLSTGLPSLDKILGGGLAYNRITLIAGEYSSGKSRLALAAIIQAQKKGDTVVYIDGEKSWNIDWAEKVGVDTSKVVVVQPRTAEEAFNIAFDLVKRRVQVLVIDSLASLRPQVELGEEDKGKDDPEPFNRQFMGNHAKLINRALNDMNAVNKGTCIIAINEIRYKVGVMYGSPETMPGGSQQEYGAWVVLRVKKREPLYEGKRRIGNIMSIEATKNKKVAPFQEVQIPFYYTGEFDEVASLVNVCVEAGIIKQRHSFYDLGTETYKGMGGLLKAIKDTPGVRELLVESLNAIPELEV